MKSTKTKKKTRIVLSKGQGGMKGSDTEQTDYIKRWNPSNPNRPPKKWWDTMYKKMKAQYPDRDDESLRALTGGIWWNKYKASTRKRITEQFEKGSHQLVRVNPKALRIGKRVIPTNKFEKLAGGFLLGEGAISLLLSQDQRLLSNLGRLGRIFIGVWLLGIIGKK